MITCLSASPIELWIQAIRPRTLPVSLAPILVGGASGFASGTVLHVPALLLSAVTAILLQIVANLANDLFDARKGADTALRKGPRRLTAAGLLTERQMRNALILTIAAALISGAGLVLIGGWVIALLGLLSILCAIAYTAGPFPLSYLGLGDLFVLLFFGPVAVCGTAWLAAGHIPNVAWPASMIIGVLIVNVLIVNNVRDSEEDAVTGKKTLVVRFGSAFGRIQYVAGLIVALLLTVLLVLLFPTVGRYGLLPLCLLPSAIGNIHTLYRAKDGPAWNRLLGRTALFSLLYALLLSLGMIAPRLISAI